MTPTPFACTALCIGLCLCAGLYSISLYLGKKFYYTAYTQVFQRMKEQTNEDTEHITNVITICKGGKDKHSVRNEKNSKDQSV